MAELERLEEHRARIEDWLHACFQDCAPRGNLYDAMRYSLLAGGKRLRPVLVLEACRLCGGAVEDALPFAGAIEMVHTYSLIHDDLPCMDDDDLRRGRPTNHKVFGEANAVLAGDGLLTAAFETMLAPGQKLPPERVLEAAGILARAAGGRGMVGGQVLDMAGEGRALGLTEVEELQRLKTGALIRAAVEMGCAVAGGAEEQREALCRYADCLGLAFQIQDDILDVVGDEATLGKPIGSDVRSDKTTFVALKGLADCRILVAELTDRAVEALAPFGSEAESLRGLAQSLAGREQREDLYEQCRRFSDRKSDFKPVHPGLGDRPGAQVCHHADFPGKAGLAPYSLQRGNAKLPLCLCLRLRGGYGLYVRLGVARIHHFCRGRHCGDVRRGQCPQGGGGSGQDPELYHGTLD